MGWKEILGNREASHPEPMLVDHQQILAYMEELCRLRTPCQLKFRQDDLAPTTVRVEAINEEAWTFTLSLSRALPPGIEEHPSQEFTFALDRGRFLCSVNFQQRGGYLQEVLGLPLRIKLADRRAMPRARFGPRERASVTLIENLGSGIGATGKLRNLGTGGLAMRVERMISIVDDRRLSLSVAPFTVGQKFLLLRINDLPHSPMVECGARIAYADTTAEGPLLGVHFEGQGSLEARILEQAILRRLPKRGALFPVKVRRSQFDLDPEAGRDPEAVAEDWDEDPGSDTEALRIHAETAAPPADDLVESMQDRSDPREKIKRLKRVGRNILLVIPDDMDRAILAGTLIVDGFRRVKEARNFTAAVESLQAAHPDLVILDQRIGTHDAQRFLERMRQHGLEKTVPVVLLAEKADVRTGLMAKAAGIAHIQAKPVDYDGSLRSVLERLLKVE